ncbi:hypothetical protein KC19_5G101600 [Ceratodon purpureus]|uniref:Secreted protein n=1 Tax=Ceratodon purpureus TaxID=3225 RepID=A0A8T0I0Q7_CERPU|nr:hypothetical protein KC19_5G101600 [Ceratodon purpureus]
MTAFRLLMMRPLIGIRIIIRSLLLMHPPHVRSCVIGCRFYMLVDDGVILQFVALHERPLVAILLGWVLGSGSRLCTMINGSQCGRISEWHAAHWMLECHNLQLRCHHICLISSTNLRTLLHHHPDPSRR